MSFRCHHALLLALLLDCCPAQDGHHLGEQGARVQLDSTWRRQVLNKDLGKDQFVCNEGGFLSRTRQAFLVVIEVESVLESKADFENALAYLVQVGHDSDVVVRPVADHLRGTRRFDTVLNGVSLTFRLELLSKDGLSYLLMAWTTRSHADFLDKKVAAALRGFSFPGQGSAWRRQVPQVEKTISVEGYELTFSHRPFVLREGARETGQLVSMQSPDGNHAVYAFELERSSLDDVLDDSYEACREGSEDYDVVSRSDFQIGEGVACRRLIARDETLTYHLLAVPLDRGRYLDVRYVSYGSPDLPRHDRGLFFESMRLERVPSAITLPEPLVTVDAVPLVGHRAKVFERAALLADTTLPRVRNLFRVADNEWVAVGWSSALRITPNAPPETLATLQGRGSMLVKCGPRWLATSSEEVVQEVRDGVLMTPEPFRARCLAPLGDDLLLVRSADTRSVLGLSTGTQMGADLLVHRTRAGDERVIARLADVRCTMLATRPEAGAALLLAARRPGAGTQAWRTGTRCLEVQLESGAVRELGEWSQVEHVAVAERGWLVTGRPAGLPAGVYHVTGEVTAVLTGERVVGVELTRDELVFASDLRSTVLGQPFALYQAKIAGIRECGPLGQPFSTRLVNEIGRRIVNANAPSTAPGSEARLRRFLDEADRVAHDLVGTELPASGPGVDALIAEVYTTSSELEPPGRILLAALVARTNLEQGAVWVESESHSWLDWLGSKAPVEPTAFAVAHTPAGLLISTLDDGEGGWNPGTTVHSQARGRTVFFGLDAGTLQARVAGATPAKLEEVLASGSVEAVRALLAARPDNVFFRERIYEHLAARGHGRVVEQVAKAFADRQQPNPVDLRAWIAAWNERVRAVDDADELARAALAAVRQHPADAMLCLLLASAYEKSKPDEPRYARSCYQRVLRMQEWGPVGDAARAGLERLR